MNKVKIGFPIEYECDGIIYDGLFLREPEIKELEKILKEINKITDLKQQVKKQKEAIDKIQMIITDMQLELIGIKPYHSYAVDGNIIRNMTKNIEDILKEVSE